MGGRGRVRWGSRQEVGKKRGRWNGTVWFGKRRVGGIQSGLGKLGGAWSALDCLHQIGMHSFLQISHMDPDKECMNKVTLKGGPVWMKVCVLRILL